VYLCVDDLKVICRWSGVLLSLEFYGRHTGGLSPHPPGDAGVFVRKKYLPFVCCLIVSETLMYVPYSKFITELRCRSTYSAKCNW
jgi:hypothetical protein